MTVAAVLEERPGIKVENKPLKATVIKEDVLRFLRSLPDESVDCIVTDPPWGGKSLAIEGELPDEQFLFWQNDRESFRRFLQEAFRVLKQDRHIYILFDIPALLNFGAMLDEQFNIRGMIAWDMVHWGMGHYYRRQHESILLASKGRKPLNNRDVPDVWEIPRIEKAEYPGQRPIALFEKMLSGSVSPGMTVCDPFCGSGSSAVAAFRAGCNFIGADLAPRAVQLTKERWAAALLGEPDPMESIGQEIFLKGRL